jgi:predicted nucleic acid-binding protein
VNNPETDLLDSWLGVEPIATGDIILTEVLQGFRNDQDYNIAKDLLTSLETFNLINHTIALKSANNYRFLRKRGITIRKTIDVIIASFCIENEIPLLFVDKDFVPFIKHLNLVSALN